MKHWLRLIKMEENNGEGGEGGGGNWRDSLPDDIKANASLADYKDVGGLAKSHIELQKMVGNSIRVPSAEAGEEDMNKFYDNLLTKAPNLMMKPDSEKPEEFDRILSILGKPEDASKYEVTKDLGDFKIPEAQMESLRTAAMGSGLTKKQFDSFVGEMMLNQREVKETGQRELNDSRTGLMREWGLAFEDRQKEAVAVLKKTGAPMSLISQAEAGQLGADTLKWAHGLVTTIGREGLEIGNAGDGGDSRLTPAEAHNQIQEIMGNPEHAYWNQSHPGCAAAREKMVELHKAASI